MPGPAADQRSVTERWMVTWFAPTIATAEGLDIYCDRPEGLSDESYRAIVAALEDLGGPVADIVRKDMRSVEIRLPWSKREA